MELKGWKAKVVFAAAIIQIVNIVITISLVILMSLVH